MGEVTSYFMSKEQLAERQEERKDRKPPIDKPIPNWNWNTITKERYEGMKKEGATDQEIVKRLNYLSSRKLKEEKEKWYQQGD